jgi:transporter family-2 protein
MELLLFTAVILAGAGTVVQTAMNAQLRSSLGHAFLGASVNFSVGLVTLIAVVTLMRIPLPSQQALSGTPWWAWFGGILGATFVAVVAFASRDLGALLVIGLIIVGQVLASIVIDHYGLLGFPVRPFGFTKTIGCILLVGGFLLMKRG